jgi:uncharacterized coiled-coil protein SlyX
VRDLIDRFKHLLDAVSREPDLPINEVLGISVGQLREREHAVLSERHRALRTQLRELDADRAARLEKIDILTALLKESEADRAAQLEQINVLTTRLKDSEADRRAAPETERPPCGGLSELK